jgi:hypothetical protein
MQSLKDTKLPNPPTDGIAASPALSQSAERSPDTRDSEDHFRRRLLRALPFVVPILIYILLALLGVTTSNIGIETLREDPTDPLGLQLGHSKGIRSDEYGTASPMWLGEIARGGSDAVTPLSAPADLLLQLPDGVVSSIVFFDGSMLALGHVVPTEVLFALKWWLPSLLLFLGLPIWFRQLTGKLRWGYLAAVLVVVAPGNAWWSGLAVNSIGFVAAACALSIASSSWLARRRYALAVLGFIVTGILFARTPTYYLPFAVMLSIPFIVATALFILYQHWPLRVRVISVAAVTVSALAWTGALFWESSESLAAGIDTVYPGNRLSTGMAVAKGFLFGATNLGGIRDPSTVGHTNQSELSTSFTLLIAVLVVLIAFSARWQRKGASIAILLTFGLASVFWLLWASFDWGAWSASIPLVNRVPSTRAALGAGFLATITFCLFMSDYRPRPRARWIAPAGAALVAGAISVGAGLLLRRDGFLPTLSSVAIIIAGVVCAAAVFALVRWPGRWWSMVPAGLAALSLTVFVSPIIFGVGDLRDSTTAQKFLEWSEESRADGSVWASDSGDVSSLMMATGMPALSGRQIVGPVTSEWEKLDPGGSNEDFWNRGGSHVTFAWAESGLHFEQPAPDAILVVASPCVVNERLTYLQHIVSTQKLDAPCLSLTDTVMWGGIPRYVYDVGSAD